MKKSINDYLLDGEVLDAKFNLSNEYIHYYNKTYAIGGIILMLLACFIAYTSYPTDWGYDIDMIKECIILGIVLFCIMEFFVLIPFLFFIHFKKNEYYITNKRIIHFNPISKLFKAIYISDITKIEINNTKFHTIKKELNPTFKIKNEEKGHYLKRIDFFNNNDNNYPYLSFKHLDNGEKVIEVINEHREFYNK
ncbi:MAG: hypothetical protein IJN90_02175 [Bacilli bacterium]|nr:hypothetical protein [Bacilli bacterium]